MEGEIAGQQASDAEVVLQEFECDSGMMSMWQTHGYIYNDGVGQHQDGIVIDVGCRMPKSELVRMVVNAQQESNTPQPTDARSTTDRGFVASHSPMHAETTYSVADHPLPLVSQQSLRGRIILQRPQLYRRTT